MGPHPLQAMKRCLFRATVRRWRHLLALPVRGLALEVLPVLPACASAPVARRSRLTLHALVPRWLVLVLVTVLLEPEPARVRVPVLVMLVLLKPGYERTVGLAALAVCLIAVPDIEQIGPDSALTRPVASRCPRCGVVPTTTDVVVLSRTVVRVVVVPADQEPCGLSL